LLWFPCRLPYSWPWRLRLLLCKSPRESKPRYGSMVDPGLTGRRPRPALRTGALLAFAVVAGLALGLVVDVTRLGGPDAWLAAHGRSPAYDPLGRLVRVGDRRVYLDCRGRG